MFSIDEFIKQVKELKDIILILQTNFVLQLEKCKKEAAIAFKEWEDSSLEERRWENYDGHDTWINPHTREVISTEQLYERFLKDKK